MTTANLTFGLLCPSFSSAKHQTQVSTIRDVSQQAEALGYDSIWVIDHFLKPPVYGQSWLDPLQTLIYIAAHTTRVKLGISVLVVPVRNPVLLAKEVATLQFFSGERFILGVGAGHNQIEFDAVQVSRKERGRRTDEIIEVVRLLLTNPSASYQGRYYQFPELAIEPLPSKPTPIWIGGGTQPKLFGSSDPQDRAAETVIQRIARADGWSSEPQGLPPLLADDWARVQAAMRAIGRDPSTFTFASHQYIHFVDTDDRERALEEQRRFYEQYVGELRPWSYVQQCYLVGSISDIVRTLKERMAIGVTYFIMAPITSDPKELERQVDLMTTKLFPQLA